MYTFSNAVCLVIPLKVNERVRINFNKCWLIAVCLVFWRTKASHSIWQLFLCCFEDATAGGSVALQMPLGKASAKLPQTLSRASQQGLPPKIRAWTETGCRVQESSKDSLRLTSTVNSEYGCHLSLLRFYASNLYWVPDRFRTTYMNNTSVPSTYFKQWLAVWCVCMCLCSVYMQVVCMHTYMCVVSVVCVYVYCVCLWEVRRIGGRKDVDDAITH